MFSRPHQNVRLKDQIPSDADKRIAVAEKQDKKMACLLLNSTVFYQSIWKP